MSSNYKNNTYRPILKQYKYIFNNGLKVLKGIIKIS